MENISSQQRLSVKIMLLSRSSEPEIGSGGGMEGAQGDEIFGIFSIYDFAYYLKTRIC